MQTEFDCTLQLYHNVIHSTVDETFSLVPRLQKLPKVSPEQMSVQLIQLLEEATCSDDIHDVEIIVSYC